MRAIDHVDRVDERAGLLGRAGDAYWRGADTGPAAQALEEAIRLFEESGKSRDSARHRLLLGRCRWERQQSDLATLEYERARDVLERFGPSEDLEAEAARLAAERAIEVAQAAGADAMRIWAYNYLGGALFLLGREAEGLEFLDRSYREAAALGLDHIAANALVNAIVYSIDCFRAGDCAGHLEDLRNLSQRGLNYLSAEPEHMVAFALGDLPEALKAAQKLLAGATELDHPHFRSHASRNMVASLTELGQLGEARAFVDGVAISEPQLNFGPWMVAVVIRFYVATGETERIRELTQVFIKNPQKVGLAPSSVDPAIEGLIAAGHLEEASEIIGVIKKNRLKEGDPWRQRIEGRLLAAQGDGAGAASLFSAAVAQFRHAGYRLEVLISQLLLASAQTSMGDRTSAEANLRQVLVQAEAISAGLVARQAREQLRGLGVEVPTPEGLPADAEASHLPSERLVTILFVDVRRFTTMTKERAPADMVDRVSALYRWGRGEIEKHHGRIDHYAGDAMMATFNVAGTRLDHAVHALEAALATRDKAAYAGLPVGIGIAVGAAIVGEFTEGGGVTALGETPNLASRLQAQARDGEILLNDEAFRRVRDWLQEKHLPADEEKLSVKGLETPVTAYRLRESAAYRAERAPRS
jgi:class 3 adenylate cyclase